MKKHAAFSDCGKYRYMLFRMWDEQKPSICWIMLNPSTADHREDDPTVRRIVDFSQRFGGGAAFVLNLYAFKTTNLAELWRSIDPIGPANDAFLKAIPKDCAATVCAWGNNAPRQRVFEIAEMLAGVELCCLGLTKAQNPRHPSRLGKTQLLLPWINTL